MRMLINNLDEEVAERPQDLVVYGGTGRAARSWEAYRAIVATLKTLANDETLLVQSGKPVGVFKTARSCSARLDREFQSGRPLVELGKVQRTGTRRPDDVRPNDRGARGFTSARKESSKELSRHSRQLGRNISAEISPGSSSSAAVWAEWVERSPSPQP